MENSKAIIALLLLPPITAELLTGSTPILNFFDLFTLVMLISSYGCGALLLRELSVKWQTQWSLFFLGCAMGVLIEGVAVQSFFNPNWVDLGPLKSYGSWLGVQWIWTIKLIFFHAFFSVILPIVFVHYRWPGVANVRLLKRRGLAIASIFFLSITALMSLLFWKNSLAQYQFSPSAVQFLSAILGVAAFVALGFWFRHSRLGSSRFEIWQPAKVGRTLLFLLLVFVFVDFFAGAGKPAVYALGTLSLAAMAMFWLFKYQIYHPQATARHIVSAVTWPIGFWLVLSVFLELKMIPNPDDTSGMSIVGLAVTLALIAWRKRILSGHNINHATTL